MSSRILVDPNKAVAKELLEYIDSVQDTLARGRRLKAQLDSMASGSDWAQVATELGLPAPGGIPPNTQAQDAWTIVSTAQAAIDAAAVAELARLDQG